MDEKQNAIKKLIERAKTTGKISAQEIDSIMIDYNFEVDELEKFYEELDALKIEINDDMNENAIESLNFDADNVKEYDTDDNDFHVQMPWGYCGNEIFNGCRQGEVNAVEAERLNAFSLMLGGKSFEEKSK